jgi:hypothetical protein
MKALMSPLAKAVLADPQAKGQLRHYLAHKSALAAQAAQAAPSAATETAHATVIELKSEGGRTLKLTPVVVPRAA